MIVTIRSGATEESEYEMASGMRYQASLFSEWSRMAEKKQRRGIFVCAGDETRGLFSIPGDED